MTRDNDYQAILDTFRARPDLEKVHLLSNGEHYFDKRIAEKRATATGAELLEHDEGDISEIVEILTEPAKAKQAPAEPAEEEQATAEPAEEQQPPAKPKQTKQPKKQGNQ